MPNRDENGGGLHVPVAKGSQVDEALRSLLTAISDSPGAVEGIQINFKATSPTSAKGPALDFVSGCYVRQVILDSNNQKKIVLNFIPDNPPEDKAKLTPKVNDHPDPADKVTWEKLLGDPGNINIDEGAIYLRMDQTAESFTVTWLPNTHDLKPVRKYYSKTDPNSPLPPTVDLLAFLTCMQNNAHLPYPVRLAVCLPALA